MRVVLRPVFIPVKVKSFVDATNRRVNWNVAAIPVKLKVPLVTGKVKLRFKVAALPVRSN
jgi:hypothetical protein